MRWWLVSCLLLVKAEVEVEDVASEVEEPMVNMPGLGVLRGTVHVARDKVTPFFQFLGVPYAAPPLGDLRFRPPAPPLPWEGERQALNDASSCLQRPYMAPSKLVGSEDCLYLNVFTRSLDPDAKKPVIVYLHEGFFIFGSASNYKGDYMMEEDVVLVVPQYRLGPFGWLSTEDKEAPGNYGLQDQLAALRWVQSNIARFGGDPNLVTISGLNAGGASVNYLMLSPNSDGLFHRAVSFSGSALCWWANLPNQKETAMSLGKQLDCPVSSSSSLVDCLRNKPAREVMKAQDNLYSWHQDKVEREPVNIWSPRPDLEAGQTAVLPVPPHTAMEVGQIQPVPFLVGGSHNEGIWRAGSLVSQDEVMMELISKFGEVAPYSLGLVGQVKEGQMGPVVNKIKEFYLSAMVKEKDLKIRLEKVVLGMINMFGDTMFNYPIDRMVKLQGNKAHSPVWVYQFNYKHNHSLANFDVASGQVVTPELELLRKPTHGHEITMMFPAFLTEMGAQSEEEEKMSRKFIKFITEYAEKGHPKHDGRYEFSEWEPVADGQLSHFVFGKYSGTSKGLPFQHRMKWWNELPAFWKKDTAKPLKVEEEDVEQETQEASEPEPRYAEGATEISEDSVQVASVEELSQEELEELEVVKLMGQLKEEL